MTQTSKNNTSTSTSTSTLTSKTTKKPQKLSLSEFYATLQVQPQAPATTYSNATIRQPSGPYSARSTPYSASTGGYRSSYPHWSGSGASTGGKLSDQLKAKRPGAYAPASTRTPVFEQALKSVGARTAQVAGLQQPRLDTKQIDIDDTKAFPHLSSASVPYPTPVGCWVRGVSTIVAAKDLPTPDQVVRHTTTSWGHQSRDDDLDLNKPYEPKPIEELDVKYDPIYSDDTDWNQAI